MKAIFAAIALVLCPLIAAAASVDLGKIDRQIVKEPAYKAKPRYALLVFGAEATTRVWVVADGNALYIDRNANGDLTEAGERIDLKPDPKAAAATFTDGGEITEPSGKKYRVHGIHNIGAAMKAAMEQQKELLKKQNAGKDTKAFDDQLRAMDHYYLVSVELPGHLRQYAAVVLLEKRQEAPVYHFAGPLAMDTEPKQSLVRGDDKAQINVRIITSGWMKGYLPTGSTAQVMVDCCQDGSVPKDVHPVVEVEFASKTPGVKPIKEKYELKERC